MQFLAVENRFIVKALTYFNLFLQNLMLKRKKKFDRNVSVLHDIPRFLLSFIEQLFSYSTRC